MENEYRDEINITIGKLINDAYRRGFQTGHYVGLKNLASIEEVRKWRFHHNDAEIIGAPGTPFEGEIIRDLECNAFNNVY